MTAALEGVSGQQHTPAVLYPRGRPATHCAGGWVGPRAENLAPLGFDPRTVKPVVSRYKISAYSWFYCKKETIKGIFQKLQIFLCRGGNSY